MTRVSRGPVGVRVVFDDPNLFAIAGLILVSTLAARLDLEALVNATVRLAGKVGGALAGRNALTLGRCIVAGGSHVDHADALRSGAPLHEPSHSASAMSAETTFRGSLASRWSC